MPEIDWTRKPHGFPPPEHSSSTSSRRAPLLIVGLLALVAIVIGVVLVTQGGTNSKAVSTAPAQPRSPALQSGAGGGDYSSPSAAEGTFPDATQTASLGLIPLAPVASESAERITLPRSVKTAFQAAGLTGTYRMDLNNPSVTSPGVSQTPVRSTSPDATMGAQLQLFVFPSSARLSDLASRVADSNAAFVRVTVPAGLTVPGSFVEVLQHSGSEFVTTEVLWVRGNGLFEVLTEHAGPKTLRAMSDALRLAEAFSANPSIKGHSVPSGPAVTGQLFTGTLPDTIGYALNPNGGINAFRLVETDGAPISSHYVQTGWTCTNSPTNTVVCKGPLITAGFTGILNYTGTAAPHVSVAGSTNGGVTFGASAGMTLPTPTTSGSLRVSCPTSVTQGQSIQITITVGTPSIPVKVTWTLPNGSTVLHTAMPNSTNPTTERDAIGTSQAGPWNVLATGEGQTATCPAVTVNAG